MTHEPDIKRWTAKRKAELIKQIYRGQTTVPEVVCRYDLTQQEVKKWMSDAGVQIPKKVAAPSRVDRRMMAQVITEMADDGGVVAVVQACRWPGASRRSYYGQPVKANPKVNEHLAARVRRVINDLPYAGYRTAAWLLGENKNTIRRLFQIKGWQAHKRRSGARSRVHARPSSVVSHPNERWATDIARVGCGPAHHWCALTIVMDCHTREALGWCNAKAAGAVLEETLITRYGALGRARDPVILRSDNSLVLTSRHCMRMVCQYGLKQEFIRPHASQQNGMVGCLIRMVKEQCLSLYNFQLLDKARKTLSAWFRYYNEQRPHQASGLKNQHGVSTTISGLSVR